MELKSFREKNRTNGKDKWVKKHTQKGSDEENPQRHIDNGRGDVDEPVGEKGGYPQEDDVIDKMVSVFVNLPITSVFHTCTVISKLEVL